MLCTPATLDSYHHSAGRFVSWLDAKGPARAAYVTVCHVREHMALTCSEPVYCQQMRTHLKEGYKSLRTQAIRL
jgi:hypothetical protein